MTRPPLIGITGRRMHGADHRAFVPELHHLPLDLYFTEYATAIADAGGLPVFLPLGTDVAAAADHLDGLLLAGGADIDPARYGAERDPHVVVVEPERDDFEFALLDTAIRHEVPVLGICRGLQVVNVFHGGTLHQHIAAHDRFDIGTTGIAHPVDLVTGTTLGRLYGERAMVNSLHHQSVDRLGDELRIAARAPDGGVEGVERGDALVAVQWHPEMMTGSSDDPLFRWLVDRAHRRSGATPVLGS